MVREACTGRGDEEAAVSVREGRAKAAGCGFGLLRRGNKGVGAEADEKCERQRSAPPPNGGEDYARPAVEKVFVIQIERGLGAQCPSGEFLNQVNQL